VRGEAGPLCIVVLLVGLDLEFVLPM
jgi:hypothetical protein